LINVSSESDKKCCYAYGVVVWDSFKLTSLSQANQDDKMFSAKYSRVVVEKEEEVKRGF